MSIVQTQVLVLGSGPGGYSAAFRAADLGLEVLLVEKYQDLGGVCLNVGCIPSKALLHTAKLIDDAGKSSEHGLTFAKPEIDLTKINTWKQSVVSKLTSGVAGMAKGRKVEVINGDGQFVSPTSLKVSNDDSVTLINFEYAIIAAGSSVVELPFMPYEDNRVMNSTSALELNDIPESLLVLGGGIIGLEMATVYSSLGSEVTVVEFADQLIPAADADLVTIYSKYNRQKFKLMLSTKVTGVTSKKSGLEVVFEGMSAPTKPITYNKILVAVGRKPNGALLNAESAGFKVDDKGFIEVDHQMRTNLEHIFAVGDIVGQPMLAHKSVHQGHVAAEVIAGKNHTFDPRCIPSVAYTDPELAWVGVTEKEAKASDINYQVANFPWIASGRAIASSRSEGKTKLITDSTTGRVIGGGIVGLNAGELLGEISLAIEMGATAEDIALTIHAHPTLNESVGMSAEIIEGTITDLPPQMNR
ncbi:dihydrolipoyl dehydrogenase [Glaciecola sp. MH2013]|uniref:dihydrolipoyl dehydrogenase n=1 Tax=Glaciecola sp. MH2013 TaxID=2785524 RepID=UPI0018A0A64F|nr:dihydrolipoyl dehydrogenase [Glaciecola sp. MH2013]MBF7073542.1 dihydrolipoyl dehydrogenase [Glaciecola sp. MH2013]